MILIIGAGIAGLTTAISLKQKGIDFLVVEAVPEIKALGAGLTLAGNAMRELKKLGLDNLIKNSGHSISEMIIQDDRGKSISVMNAKKFSQQHGLDNVAIHRGVLHNILLGQIDAAKIITGKKAIRVKEEGSNIIVWFEDGTSLSAAGVIVADGIHSILRKQLISESLPRYSGYPAGVVLCITSGILLTKLLKHGVRPGDLDMSLLEITKSIGLPARILWPIIPS